MAQPGARRLCGSTLLDTGEVGLVVRGAQRPRLWQRGVAARLAMPTASDDRPATLAFRTGDEAHGARAQVLAGRGDGVSITTGVLPFHVYDILFEQGGTVAVRPSRSAGASVRPVIQ